MPSYKLHYFNIRARAEVARFIFAYADMKYEDIRYENEQWAEFKPSRLYLISLFGMLLTDPKAFSR